MKKLTKCKFCPTKFEQKPLGRTKNYCSDYCYNKHYYYRTRERRLELKKKNYAKNPEQKKIWQKKWDEKNYDKILKHTRINARKYKMKEKNKIKCKAHKLVSYDKIKNPHLYPKECCICGETHKVEMHHPIYSFPYNVYPLCKKHHIEIHQGVCVE